MNGHIIKDLFDIISPYNFWDLRFEDNLLSFYADTFIIDSLNKYMDENPNFNINYRIEKEIEFTMNIMKNSDFFSQFGEYYLKHCLPKQQKVNSTAFAPGLGFYID